MSLFTLSSCVVRDADDPIPDMPDRDARPAAARFLLLHTARTTPKAPHPNASNKERPAAESNCIGTRTMERLIQVIDGAPGDPISVFALGTWMARTSPSIWYTCAKIETSTDGALCVLAISRTLDADAVEGPDVP